MTTETEVMSWLVERAPARYQTGDVTVEIAKTAWGLGDNQCRRKLNKMAADGLFTVIPDAILPNGKSGTLYRPVVESQSAQAANSNSSPS